MKARADLHTHSAYSDGSDTPAVLVRKAEEMELGGIALTDHDTLMGLKDFMDAASRANLIGVPGVEISTEHDGKEVHLLGYFVPFGSEELSKRLEPLSNGRLVRFLKMVEKLRKIGIDVRQDEVDNVLRGVESPGRPHLAGLLVRKGVVRNSAEAFQQYLVEGKPAYVKKDRLGTVEAIRLLRSAGAVPVIAHPMAIETSNLREFLKQLQKSGAVGVEIEYDYAPWGTAGSPEDVRKAVQGLGFIETGGSDYHGNTAAARLGSATVEIKTIEKLREAAELILSEG
ncbi:MAG: PHP domain-containing protein [Candidatus Thorarchaeota archaeon]|nr:MAG: PHP domain-containing protein [Candidatus Thorarchaeota archaeon]